jgi:hypothetical protein
MRYRSTALTALALAGALTMGVAAMASANHFTTLSTSMTGAEEAPGPGDPNGKGFITLDVFATGTICWEAKIQGIDGVSVAHIHKAPAGQPGGVVVDLRPDQAEVTGNKYEWCVSTTPDIAAQIVATPTDYYVNFHNADFQPGAIRGQLGD